LEEQGLNPTIDEYKEGEANVFAEIGPKGKPAFLMSGHVDTVPIGKREAWTHDPFSAKIIDGELWGRGSVDMKGGTASLAGVLVELMEHEDDLQQRLFFAATAEEETGLKGAEQYVESGKIKNITHVLIAEPTDLVPNNMEKGIIWANILASGKQAHASRPDLGYNAIEGLASLLPKLYEAIPELDNPLLGKTSLNVGMIEGGTAANVVPQDAQATIDMRTTPGVDNDDVIKHLQQIINRESGDVSFDIEILESAPSILSPTNDFAEQLAIETGKHTGKKPDIGGVHYATDGAVFMEALDHQPQFIIYGPGSTELLHQTNERLDLKQLEISTGVISKCILDEISK
jgi:succinyl-diaminopimelate desuccinylase